MPNYQNVNELNAFLKKLQREEQTFSIVRLICRVKALIAYYKGNKIKTVANCFDVSEKTLKRWIKRFEAQGCESLEDKSRSGRPPKLSAEQLEELKKIIEEDNQRVWVARHVYILIVSTFSMVLSVRYIPELLRSIGLSFHKTVHYLAKRNNEKRNQWIQEKLPEIYKDKINAGWRVFYQDEVGFQTEGTLAYTWSSKGEKVEIQNFGLPVCLSL